MHSTLSRREWVGRTLGTTLALGLQGATRLGRTARAAEPDEVALIVRSRRPIDLETPVTALTDRITSNDVLFVRSHFGHPVVNPESWTLQIDGLVERPSTWTLKDLHALESVETTAVLQCAGNGRAFFQPRIPGLAWERGAVGNVVCGGVRLRDLLDRAGLRAGAAHVHFLGADGPPAPKTPAFLRSVPLDKVIAEGTILATTMNGAPLPVLHGGPLRLIVPGWTGNHWLKWVRSLTVSRDEAPGFYMQTGYRIPRTPAPPDAVLTPADLVPVTTMNVKSLITAPGEGDRLRLGPRMIQGVAWTGEGHVTSVEVKVGDDAWRAAQFLDERDQWGWRRWSLAWTPERPGAVVLRARATDSQGQTQPDLSPWNKSGYLWNGIDAVKCEVV